jgi:hypothetical protein
MDSKYQFLELNNVFLLILVIDQLSVNFSRAKWQDKIWILQKNSTLRRLPSQSDSWYTQVINK